MASRLRSTATSRRSRRSTPRDAGRRSGRTPVERLRAICLALPETTEKVAWGEPTWRVRGRLFAQLDDHHHGADHLAVWLPAPLGEQEAMIFTDPARFFRPPYVGQRGWIGVRIDRRPRWALVARLVEQAYRQVAPPLRRRGARAPAPSGPGRRRS
jgi:predicted DNA-binding protein (MmcQ/YjbR family)